MSRSHKPVLSLRKRGRAATVTAVAASLVTLMAATWLPASSAVAAPVFEVDVVDEVSMMQGVRVLANAGQFRLRLNGETTGDIAFNAPNSTVQAALNNLTSINAGGGSVTVTGGPGNVRGGTPYYVAFDGGPLAHQEQPMLKAVNGTTPLSGGGATAIPYLIRSAGVSRSDQRMDYTITVRNAAQPADTAAVGATLTCSPTRGGNWFPNVNTGEAPTLSYRWLSGGVEVPGATQTTYTVAAGDAGKTVQCVVTGTNVNATTSFVSLPAMIVAPQPDPLPPAPVSATGDSRPTIAGTGAAMRTCMEPPNWTAGGTPVSYQFQWLRNAVAIDGEIASTYTPDAGVGGADVDKVLQCQVVGSTAGGSIMGISNNSIVGTVPRPPNNAVTQTPVIGDPNQANGPVTLTVDLPAGMGTEALNFYAPDPNGRMTAPPEGWSCVTQPAAGTVPAKAVCTRPDALPPGQSYPPIGIGVGLGADAPDDSALTATVTGGGAVSASSTNQFSFTSFRPFGFAAGTFTAEALDPVGNDYTQAGGHPHAAASGFALNRDTVRRPTTSGANYNRRFPSGGLVKDALADIPAGFVGNPQAVTKLCNDTESLLAPVPTCPVESMVGGIHFLHPGLGGQQSGFAGPFGLYLMKPERGAPAQIAFGIFNNRGVYMLEARLRPDGGYAVGIDVKGITQSLPLMNAQVLLCSYGGRLGVIPAGEQFNGCKAKGDPDAFEKPFLTSQTECSGQPPVTKLHINSWENPGVFDTAEAFAPLMDGCELVPFTPTFSVSPTSRVAGSPSGLEAEISVSSDGLEDPDGLSQAHLRKTVVELPAGVSVNPSAATGLEGCTDAQLGLKTDSEPGCPDGSRVADVQVTSPLLVKRDEDGTVLEDGDAQPEPVLEPVDGTMVLRTPESTDPMSGGMFRMALIVRNDERGILVKLPGSATADPQTGRLVATFDDNPQLPIANVRVQLKGGQRGMLAMPQDCGPVSTKTTLTPWSGNADAVSDTPAAVGGDCSKPFAPALDAGMDTQAARANGKFSFRFTRRADSEQWLRGLTAKLPPGLLASVKHVDLCSDAQANAGTCPLGSQIGIVDAKAGAGDPFVLEQKGRVYLTEGYKGGEYGLAVKIRPIAGPFRGAMELSPIIVRQAVHVDRKTAQVTAVSDPFPLIHHGIPLRAREINVLVDRDKFMLNPSDCSAKQVGADILSAEGATASVASRFQASGCAALPFRPRLGLRLIGPRQVRTGGHPAIRALVRQNGVSEAGIGRAEVRLPRTLALDVDNAQALCEFEDGTKPDLENRCPRGSIVGRARAQSPLLKDDLVGNVYFVKNVRIDPDTGNEIRTLPMIVAALRGEIAVNLVGESDVKGGKLVNTFDEVPDAPISQFNLNIRGGKNGIIAVTRTRRSLINLCSAGRQIAEADMDGQNGKRHDFNVNMRKPCPRRRPSAAAVCRKRTNTKPALRRCVRRVKANRAKAAKRKAAAKRKQAAAKRRNARG